MASTDARPIPLKNTAFRVTLPILDADGDLVTGATGLDSEVSKDGGAFADCTNESTEIGSSGIYTLDLTSTEMNADTVVVIVKTSTSGAKTTPIIMYPKEAGDVTVVLEGVTHTGAVIPTTTSVTNAVTVGTINSGVITATSIAADAITAAKVADGTIDAATFAAGAINAAAIASDAITAAKIADGAIDAGALASDTITAAKIATDAITAAKIASDAVTEIQSGLATAAALAAVDDFVDTEIAAIISTLGTPAGASLAADIAAIEAQTDDIGVAGAGLTAIPWNAAWDAEVQSEVADALGVYDPPTHAELVSEINDVQTDVAALNDLSATQVEDAVWDAVLSDHQDAGSTGEALDAATTGGGPTAAEIADAVWDETLGDHTDSGSTGEALGAAGGAGDPWITALPGSYSSGQAGFIVGTNLNATVSSRASQTSVDDLPTNAELATALAAADDAVLAAIAALNNLSSAQAQTAAAAALTAYDPPTHAELTAGLAAADDAVLAAIAALNNLSAAQVNAEVVDALNTDSYAELASIPAAATTLTNMLRVLYYFATNELRQDATTQTLRNRADSATIGTAAVSDDGSEFVRGSFS